MRRQLIFGTVLSMALGAGLAAQQPAQERPQTGGETQRKPQTMTVTGCLQTGDASASGEAARGDTTSRQQGSKSGTPARFILTDATVTSGGGATAGTTGAAGSKPGAGAGSGAAGSRPESAGATAATTYRLMGQEQKLKQFVNSRVEVTGTLQSRGGAGQPSGRPGTGTGATGSGGAASGAGAGAGAGSGAGADRRSGEGNEPALRVTSVRQVAGTCSGGERR